MGINITVTDTDLPVTSAFIRFIYSTLKKEAYYTANWYRQEDENLFQDESSFKELNEKARAVAADPKGNQYLLRSYSLFRELLIGKTSAFSDISKFRFFFVIGFPRTGGTYLTKQLFLASGVDYKDVQGALAHDAFPHLSYMTLNEKGNSYTNGLLQLAEYLTMVRIFFGEHERLLYRGGTMVPKKFTRAVYNFDLIRDIFGANSEYIITLRHPLSVCKSILDRCGGMPEGRKFATRSNIENWALEDWVHRGVPKDELMRMDYVKCILGYWKRYHFQMAMAGIPGMPTASIVPYGEEHMTGFVRQLYSKFGLGKEPEAFKKSAPPEFTEEDEKEASKAMEEVAVLWKSLGMEFPVEALSAKL